MLKSKADLPIGDVVLDPSPAPRPEHRVLKGRYVTLEPLSVEKHSDSIYEDMKDDPNIWFYLLEEPPADREAMRAVVAEKSKSQDPLFFAVIDNATGRALGWQSFLRIEPNHRVIEVGYITYGSSLQRTRGSTEAQYLFASYVFDVLGYRRYEWKCNNLNAPSKKAAQRLGFVFEGVFRQHMISKGRNRDSAWFSILDREWPRHKAAFEAWLDPSNFDHQGVQIKPLSAFRT